MRRGKGCFGRQGCQFLSRCYALFHSPHGDQRKTRRHSNTKASFPLSAPVGHYIAHPFGAFDRYRSYHNAHRGGADRIFLHSLHLCGSILTGGAFLVSALDICSRSPFVYGERSAKKSRRHQIRGRTRKARRRDRSVCYRKARTLRRYYAFLVRFCQGQRAPRRCPRREDRPATPV